MKHALRTGFLLVLLSFALVLAAVFPAWAALPEASAPADSGVPASLGNWFDSLIPVLAPLLVALIKTVIPRVPKPLLPLLATGLGVGLDYLGQAAGLSASNPILGAVLGAAGVGLREALDQTKKSLAGTASVVVLFLALSFAFTGCASKRPPGQIVSFTQRVIGIDASENAVSQTPQLRLGFVSTTYHVVPTATNIMAPPVSSSIDLSHKPFATGITEQFSTGASAK